MIRRDLASLDAGEFDLAIVGGGIYGAALAFEAARRGLKPALIERGDFGGATTWNSLRIVHGGLRYLQSADLARFRESVNERRWWLRHFPDLVRPLACMMPLYGHGMRRPAILRLALAANDLLSWRRNAGVVADRALPRGRVLGPDEVARRFPAVRRAGLRGAALWHDGSMPDSQRLVIELLHWACAAGAAAVNYTEALSLELDGRTVAGLRVRDTVSGSEHEVAAPLVVNCAGPWCRELAGVFDRDRPELFRFSLAFNLLLDREPPADSALGVEPPEAGARTYFLHPWKGRVLAGTFHAPWRGGRSDRAVDEGHLQTFLGDLNRAIPGWEVRRDEVLRIHWGYLPAREEGSAELASRAQILDHRTDGGPSGLFSVSGVKYTTARRVAESTLATIRRDRGGLPAPAGPPRPPTAGPPSLATLETWLENAPGRAVAAARRLIETEAALWLDDLILRRTDWGMDPRKAASIASRLAPLLASDIGPYRPEPAGAVG